MPHRLLAARTKNQIFANLGNHRRFNPAGNRSKRRAIAAEQNRHTDQALRPDDADFDLMRVVIRDRSEAAQREEELIDRLMGRNQHLAQVDGHRLQVRLKLRKVLVGERVQ
jgi:hypothetical protein